MTYRNPALEYVHRYFERSAYLGFHSIRGAWENSAYRLDLLFTTNLSLVVLLLPLLVGLFTTQAPWSGILKFTAGLFVLALWSEIFVFPHYIAPLIPVVWLIVIVGLWKLSVWHWRIAPVGRSLVAAVMIGTLVGSALADTQPMYTDRDMLSQQAIVDAFPTLQQGRHLIFVAYGPMHSYHSELVHNLSNMDQQNIIWARRLDDRSDRDMATAYPDRNVWMLYIGGKNTLTRLDN